jgi:hypothetical protein
MNKTILTLAAISLAAASAWSQSTTVSITNSTATVVPEGNLVGAAEIFSVSGLSGAITDAQLSLDISGGFNGSLYAYLAGPGGQTAILLNRVGLSSTNLTGYSDAGFDITLDSLATNDIHTYQNGTYNLQDGQLAGTWAADGRNLDPQSPGGAFDAASPTLALNIFNGLNAATENGVWTLFIADVAAGGGSPIIDQTILSVTAIPEPSSLALAVVGAAAAFGCWRQTRG